MFGKVYFYKVLLHMKHEAQHLPLHHCVIHLCNRNIVLLICSIDDGEPRDACSASQEQYVPC